MTHTPATRPLLLPLVPVYRLGLALREFQLHSGLKPIRRLRFPVVSVGSLSAGGAGKTPLTIALAKAFTAHGLHVDVLSRGYGRRPSALPLLVDPEGTAQEFGDEPLLIAREACVPVYVAAERYKAGLLAEKASQQAGESARRQIGVHVLDDGFQHRQLARDIDILLVSRSDLADHLLPAGNLREALHAAKRASVIAIPADEPEIETELRSIGWQGTAWRIRRHMEIPQFDGAAAVFCGIARPDQFFKGLEAAGVKLATRTVFPDHHTYTTADIARIESKARSAGAATLLTTEKDRVRIGALAASFPILAVPLRIEIEDENLAIDWLIHLLRDPA